MSFPEPHVQTRRIGRFTVHAIQAGGLQLDGGAMFGVVPKPLWEKRLKADDRNRIPMCMRCLLIEHDAGLVLIDTGAGNKEDAKFYGIYGVENTRGAGPTALEDGIRAAGFSVDDVTLVINTHLHFDHAGGNTFRDQDGTVRASFPNARYVVQGGEHRYATNANERTSASYFAPNYAPIIEAGRFDFIDGAREIVRGIHARPTPGHTPHHQSIMIDGGGERAVFLADVMPTAHHFALPWIMGYDVEPLVTLESKRALLTEAAEEDWLLVFEHDAHTAWGRARRDGKSFVFEADR